MSNEMFALAECVFGNGTIRMFGTKLEPWFVGIDVATALGYKRPHNAITRFVDEDDSLLWGVTDALGRVQETILINESGMYALIFGSELPEAKKFKHWVTHEVLPQIRKYGNYNPDVIRAGKLGRPELTHKAQHQREEAKKKHWTLANGEVVNRDQVRVYCLDLGASVEFACKRDVEIKIKFIDDEMAARGISDTKELWRYSPIKV